MRNTSTSMLPRADASTDALAGVLDGLMMLFLTDSASAAAIGAFAVLIVQFGIEYLVPSMKLTAGAIAGFVVVVATGIYSLAIGLPLDEAAFQTAGVYLVTSVLTYLIPSGQP